MRFDSVKKLKGEAFRRLTGVQISTFEDMVGLLFAAKRRQKAAGGKPNTLCIEDQLLMMLEYLREDRTYFHIAQTHGISESAAYRNIKWCENTLARSKTFRLPGRKAVAVAGMAARHEAVTSQRCISCARPEYDAALTDVYTNINPSKVYEERFIVAALTEDALSDTAPLYETISHYVDEKMLAKIAAEYNKGRLLLIQTTDLDAGQPVLWNIGAIAASGDPRALDVVRHILLASASIPAAFPPVMFDVEADGKPYQEMHVDGGAVSQAFLVPPSLNVHAARERAGYRRSASVAYIIRNSRLKTDWSDVERRTLSIAQRAVSTLINYNGVGDLYRMYLTTQRAGASFNLAYISDDFQAEHKEEFDQNYMRALYRYAYDKAATGYPWQHAPPGFAPKER
jgi:Helix-turn-helix of DDE superfamily endonuclease